MNNIIHIGTQKYLQAFQYVIIISLLLPVLIISVSFSGMGKSEIDIILSGIWYVHKNNPLLFLADIIPVILCVSFYYYLKKNESRRILLEAMLREKNENIIEYTEFAETIGAGIYTAELKDINKDDPLGRAMLIMRNNLSNTQKKEAERNRISEGREIISGILRKHTDINNLADDMLLTIIEYAGLVQGAFYIYDEKSNLLVNHSTYAYNRKKYINQEFKIGYGLIGQAAYEMDSVYRKEIPEDYVTITSGILGDKKPGSILIVPLVNEERLQGVMEFASLADNISEQTIMLIEELSVIIAQTLNNLKINKRTEDLLKESQSLTEKLQDNEGKLRQSAKAMEATQEELEITNRDLELKIQEIKNSEKRMHALMENAFEVISIYDREGRLKYESPSVKNILGYTSEEMVGDMEFSRVHELEVERIERIFAQLLISPEIPQTFEFKYNKKNGEIIWLESTGRNFLGNPAIDGIVLNTRDITMHKLAEKEQRMKGQMKALSENSPDMIIRLSPDGYFYYVNPIAEVYTGIKTEDIIKRSVDEVPFNEQIIGFFKKIINEIKNDPEKIKTEIDFPSVYGNRIMQINAIPELNENNELESILIVAHDITERKKIELEVKNQNKKITESINYAERIQSSILPDTAYIRKFFPESFVFYKPKDVISGDFPWFFNKGENFYIAAVDCTGHGVPGALISFIGYFLLNNLVDHDREMTAGEILDLLHFEVRRTLKQDIPDAEARDGMDIAFCKINFRKKEIQYAGAHRPLYLLRNKEMIQYKGDRKAIGGIPHKKKKEKDFMNYKINIENGDRIFFFSDGLPDQVGGPFKQKYKAKRIRDIIVDHPEFSMTDYNRYFAKDFKTWKGNNKQIDDVLLIGIEF